MLLKDFSGDFLKNAETGGKEEENRKEILRKIKVLKKDKNIPSLESARKIEMLEDDLKRLTYNKYHNQTNSQKQLNKASTYIRFNQQNGYNATIDVIGDAWLQNFIHRTIKDFRFEYEHKNIEGWGGIKF